MVKLLKSFYFLGFLVLVASCATGTKEVKYKLRSQVISGDYSKALSTLETSKYFKENQQSRLLFLMEKGLIYHGMGRFAKSIEVFEEAKTLARKQYTVRISKKLTTYIGNDSSDIYYGEKYELSMLYFYQSLNHYLLSFAQDKEIEKVVDGKQVFQRVELSDKDRRDELFKARAELLAWDSFLKELGSERAGESVFKNDLAAKVLGGFIHEAIGTRDDLQIAYQLYKDALILLVKNYGAYKTFNSNFESYVKDFEKFPSLGVLKVKKNYITETDRQVELKEFLQTKVLTFAKKYRKRSWKQEIRPFDIDLSKIKTKKSSNITLVLQESIIPDKFGEKQYYGLGKELSKSPGGAILAIFAADVLGLFPPPKSYNPAGAHLGYNVAKLALSEAAVQFELPKIEKSNLDNSIVLEVWKKNKIVLEKVVPVVNPLGDIAEQAVVEQSAWLYPKIGARLATKHAVAIVAAFGTYQALKGDKGDNEFLAKNAAILQYIASSKGIEASEQADVRQWSTIPKALRMLDFYLPNGSYRLVLRSNAKVPKTHQIGQLIVSGQQKNHLIQTRVNF
ncbi:hypothetical protein [Halobacteriovorax sp. HLS]|uniref:hypothetical protein n=1 Tax=Halobacteriovorax sp. HLS TaxID=2234000 RepID=UPI000FDBE19A|nr:hypothetical protein [Halobacteriovorax sp. HLS]